jgi:two-component system cell cycle sensor histidine kinase/response regulator CckA
VTLTHAFEPFYTTKSSGTGLGLYIVYGIVQSLGGRIDVESHSGQGTLFRILLPAWQAVRPVAPSSERRPRILVVEDERLIRITLRHTLGASGFDVLLAADAAEARAQFETSGGVDLLLSDMILPGATGADLAREFLAQDPNLHVLFMSAYPRELLMAQGRITAEQPTLEKPFSEEALAAAVAQALGSLAARQ